MRVLIERGADPNARAKHGATPLDLAAALDDDRDDENDRDEELEQHLKAKMDSTS